jgi:O-antigen/teichoic acid export membrane protein
MGDSPINEADTQPAPAKMRLFWSVSLYRNAAYLIIGNGIAALLGFVYWGVAARFYTVEEVGLASAAIAAMGMLGSLSTLGLNLGMIRFLPMAGDRRERIINPSLTISALASIAMGVVFILGLNLWSPRLLSIKHDWVYFFLFVVFAVATAGNLIADNVFVAYRRANLTTVRNTVFNSLKLLLVALLARSMGSYGILVSWGVGLVFSLLVGLVIFLPGIHRGYFPLPSFKWVELGGLVRYSLVNNASVLLGSIPVWVLPLVVLDRLGAEANAYFYICWTIGTALAMVPLSVATSLFAEGSNDQDALIFKAIRTLCLVTIVQVPIAAVMIMFGHRILHLFGANYSANGTLVLTILVLALFPIAVNQLYFSVIRVQDKRKELMVLAGLITAATLIFCTALLPILGILGAGLGWLAGQTIVALWVLSKERWWKPLFVQMLDLLLLKKMVRRLPFR